MIDFKIIELSDKKEIDSYFTNNRFRTCNLSFANMFAWQTKFKTSFAVIRGTLFIRYFDDTENALCYLMPIGEMNLQRSLQIIIDDTKENNIKFIMKQVTSEMWDIINISMPDTFQYQNDRDNYEYIYLSERLIKLPGRNMQSKRNHINHFKFDNQHWNYIPITTIEELEECSEMLDKWENLNFDKARQSLRYDYIATKILMKNFHFFMLKGGAIKINDKIVAFTIGEQLTDDTFVIHVEKAFNDINGAYAIINQQFAEHEASNYLYINREEDMGLEYLRKAKMSYHPDILLQKKVLTLKEIY